MTGLPQGDTDTLLHAAMINVLGRTGRGPAQLHGMHRALALPGASVHIYGAFREPKRDSPSPSRRHHRRQ